MRPIHGKVSSVPIQDYVIYIDRLQQSLVHYRTQRYLRCIVICDVSITLFKNILPSNRKFLL
jgi:hypothetical protein